ncbi:MAG: hypothetical protein M1509_06905 [Nitrospirae bacterium]|nr:hypothetical protein [Nitrospirota bacterium]
MKNTLSKTITPSLAALASALILSACQTMGSSDPIALEIQSREALHAGEIDRSLSLTEALIAKEGPTPASLNQMALLKSRKGKVEAAGRILRYAHGLYPASAPITLNLAKFEASRGEMSAARAILLPLLSGRTWPDGFRLLMGRVDMETGHLPEASILLHEALRRHPDNPLVLANMGLLHERLGEMRMAHRNLLKAKELAPRGALRQRIVALLHSIAP